MSLTIHYAYSRFRMSMSFAWSSSKILTHEQMFNLILISQNHVITIQPFYQLYFYKKLLVIFSLTKNMHKITNVFQLKQNHQSFNVKKITRPKTML